MLPGQGMQPRQQAAPQGHALGHAAAKAKTCNSQGQEVAFYITANMAYYNWYIIKIVTKVEPDESDIALIIINQIISV